MIRQIVMTILVTAPLAACQAPLQFGEPSLIETEEIAPPGATPGTCWGKDVTPAVIETVTEHIMLQPAEVQADGTVTAPAMFKTETRQQIVRERRETWFQTPCDDALTPEFITSLQRALEARGFYRGPLTGEMDARTRRAVRAYQAPQGLSSGILSLAAAQKLGLSEVTSH